MSDEQFQQEELGRRTLEISNMQEDLQDAKDRVDDANRRTITLKQNISKLQQEIDFRKEKVQEMETALASLEAKGTAAKEAMLKQEQAHRLEIDRLNLATAETLDAKRLAESKRQETTDLCEELAVQLSSTKGKLEVLRCELAEYAASEDSAEREEDSLRETMAQQEACSTLDEATSRLESEAEGLLGQVASLSEKLKLEQECTQGLAQALEEMVEKQGSHGRECEFMRKELEVLRFKKEEDTLMQSLASVKQQRLELAQQVHSWQNDSMMETLSVEGALEETRRILSAHREEQEMQLEASRRNPEMLPTSALTASLAEVKKEVEVARRELALAKAEANFLESRNEQEAEEYRSRKLETKDTPDQEAILKAATAYEESELRNIRDQEILAKGEVEKAESELQEVEQYIYDEKQNLRLKLQELWAAIKDARTARDLGSLLDLDIDDP